MTTLALPREGPPKDDFPSEQKRKRRPVMQALVRLHNKNEEEFSHQTFAPVSKGEPLSSSCVRLLALVRYSKITFGFEEGLLGPSQALLFEEPGEFRTKRDAKRASFRWVTPGTASDPYSALPLLERSSPR